MCTVGYGVGDEVLLVRDKSSQVPQNTGRTLVFVCKQLVGVSSVLQVFQAVQTCNWTVFFHQYPNMGGGYDLVSFWHDIAHITTMLGECALKVVAPQARYFGVPHTQSHFMTNPTDPSRCGISVHRVGRHCSRVETIRTILLTTSTPNRIDASMQSQTIIT